VECLPFPKLSILHPCFTPSFGNQLVAREAAGLRQMLEHAGEPFERHLPCLKRYEAIIVERQRNRVTIMDLQLVADFRRQHEQTGGT
jgi:hypothetical protein